MKKTTNFATQMIGNTILLLLILFSVSFPACAQTLKGNGNVITEVREVSYFNGISVSSSIDLYITMGDEFHVKVEADDNIIDHIETETRGEELIIGLKGRGISIRNSKEMNVYVTLPELLSLTASGATDVTVNNTIEQPTIRIKASGASDINLPVNVEYLEMNLSGASDARISGYTKATKATLSGASDFKNSDLVTGTLDVNLSGSSNLKIKVNENITGTLSGASDLVYEGNPTTDLKTSGASSVKKK
ncbi:MAG: head GIN domain-containing protein [Bacteroidota bacterium]